MNATSEAAIPDQLLSVARVLRLVGVTDSTLRVWIRGGKIPAPMRLGGKLYWRPEAIDEWLRSSEERSPVDGDAEKTESFAS